MVILTALNKEAARRFGSIAAFARAFEQAASVPGQALPLPVNSATPPQSVPPQQPAAPLPLQMPISLSSEAPPPPPFYPSPGASAPRLPVAPPAPLYPAASNSPLLPPTIAPNSPTPFPATPQQPMVLPPVQPYAQSVQPYAQSVQPYEYPSQPYAPPVKPYEYPITGAPQQPAVNGHPH